ncbi:MAG: efflux RND transporter periplasmic adaptor subunit [Pirellulales bacterium]
MLAICWQNSIDSTGPDGARSRVRVGRVVSLASAVLVLTLIVPASALAELLEGFTEPLQTIEVAASEVGIVTKLLVKEGQQVAAGDMLAELDNEVLEATLEVARVRADAQGATDAATAERDLRRYSLEQLEKLLDKGHATAGELARARADFTVAEARVRIAQEEQKLALLECRRIQSQIERRRIRSPISGLVAEVHREAGESFLGGDPRILTLVNVAQLRVRFQVSAQQALTLTPGQAITLHLPDIDLNVEATVERVSPMMDAKSGTVEVTMLIDNTDAKRQLRSGMRCTVELEGGLGQPVDPVDAVDSPTRTVTHEETGQNPDRN